MRKSATCARETVAEEVLDRQPVAEEQIQIDAPAVELLVLLQLASQDSKRPCNFASERLPLKRIASSLMRI